MEKKFKKQILNSEKAFLSKASFKVHHNSLDARGKECLNEMPTLQKTSVDPKHLTILHNDLAYKTANIISDLEMLKPSKLFIELNPGCGFVSQNLIEISNKKSLNNDKFVLVEAYRSFLPKLEALKNSLPKNDITLMSGNSFHPGLVYKNKHLRQILKKHIKETPNTIIYGIIPWNTKGYLTSLFTDYASSRGIFQFKSDPVFYLYMPDILLAKLNPNSAKIYMPFQCSLTILSHMFSNCQILNEETSDYFFPYPQVSMPYSYNKYPFNNIDLKKMSLVRLQFKSEQENLNELNFIKDKRLFYLFISQVFVRPTEHFKYSIIKSICKDIDYVCKTTGINAYTPIKKMEPIQFFKIFKYLLDNQDQVVGDNLYEFLNNKSVQNLSKDRERGQLQSIKMLNKNLTGRLIVPDTLINDQKEIKSTTTKSNSLLDNRIKDFQQNNNESYEDLDNDFEFDLNKNGAVL